MTNEDKCSCGCVGDGSLKKQTIKYGVTSTTYVDLDNPRSPMNDAFNAIMGFSWEEHDKTMEMLKNPKNQRAFMVDKDGNYTEIT